MDEIQEYHDVRSEKNGNENFKKFVAHAHFFPNFSVNNGGGKLIFGMDVENGRVLETKWEKKSKPNYQMPPGGAERGNWNAQHSLRQQNDA